MTLIRRFFSGPSLTQAVLAAARHHELDPDELAYEVIDKKHGFLKTPRGVVIEVDPDQPAKPATAESAPAPDTGAERVETATVEPAAEPVAEPAAEPAAEPEPEAAAGDRLAALTEPVPEGSTAFAPPPAPIPEEPATAAAENAALDSEAPAPEPEAPASPAATEEPTASDAPREPEREAVARAEAEPAAEPEKASEREPSVSETPPLDLDDDLRDAVARAIDELAFFAGLRVQVGSAEASDDGLAVDLEGPDSGKVVGHGGRALLAMQHLLPRLLFSKLGRSVHCRVDCEGFHEARSARLERLARKAADRVRSGGRSWLLEPMAPDERRLVHLALAEEPDVETESVGEGYLKRVRVAQV